mmetsp:Transcript_41415/g.163096  ORF Transcript_41415/g.163096 Transcript_41415/m.163096 type:complete len:93 (-) Transcript_41415:78-356(-)
MFCHVSTIINGIMPSIGRLNHVAVAVKNCDRAAKLWRALGLEVNKVDRLPEHGVKGANGRRLIDVLSRFDYYKRNNAIYWKIESCRRCCEEL